jgi:hypothetical protein
MEILMDSKPPENQPPGDYAVGYGRPPKAHQFKKGEPPPPRGEKKLGFPDIDAILNEPIPFLKDGALKQLHPLEAELQSLASKAVGGDLKAVERLFKKFKALGVLTRPMVSAVVQGPTGMHPGVFNLMYHLCGRPPYTKGEEKWGYRKYLAQRNDETKAEDAFNEYEEMLQEHAK